MLYVFRVNGVSSGVRNVFIRCSLTLESDGPEEFYDIFTEDLRHDELYRGEYLAGNRASENEEASIMAFIAGRIHKDSQSSLLTGPTRLRDNNNDAER